MNASLTVEALKDIVSSQICIYGNKSLFLKSDIEHNETFLLFAGESAEQEILECVNHSERCANDGGSQALLDRLETLDESLVIYCSDDEKVLSGFAIGFQSSEEGFIETIASTELIKPTIVK